MPRRAGVCHACCTCAPSFPPQWQRFHRTTRQSCNLFELRDLVTGFTQNISNTVSSIEAVQTSINTMQAEIDAAAVEANVAAFQQNVSLRLALAALERQIDQAFNAADTPCIPYVEFTNANGACVQLNRTCDAYDHPHYERVSRRLRPHLCGTCQPSPASPCGAPPPPFSISPPSISPPQLEPPFPERATIAHPQYAC